MPAGVELLGGDPDRERDEQQPEHCVEDAWKVVEGSLEHEGGEHRTGNRGGGEEIGAALVHETHVAICECAGHAVGGDEGEDGSGDNRGVLVEEDAEDGYEDEAAARADEDAEDSSNEANHRKRQPLDRLLPT